jgi:hypothetical protein
MRFGDLIVLNKMHKAIWAGKLKTMNLMNKTKINL